VLCFGAFPFIQMVVWEVGVLDSCSGYCVDCLVQLIQLCICPRKNKSKLVRQKIRDLGEAANEMQISKA
jgi:hypothetical protein